MRVKNKRDIISNFKFEAPVVNAGKKGAGGDSSGFETVDLNALLAPVPENCYLVRVTGESMIDESIFPGDLLVVDKSELPANGKIVIASLNGEPTVKKLFEKDGAVSLVSANKKFLPIEISGYMNFEIQGVVKFVIKKPEKL